MSKEDKGKAVLAETDNEEATGPTIEGELDWRKMTKKQLDKFAEKQGITLNGRKSLANMQKDYTEALAKKE